MSGDRDRGGWDWARHVPASTWETPDDLNGPTGAPDTNLLIAILVSDLVGNDVAEIVGELIAERARFNMWYATRVDGRVPPETQAALYTLYRDIAQRIHEPWRVYRLACEAVSGEGIAAMSDGEVENLARPEYDALLETLRTTVRELAEARRGLE